MLTLKTNPRIFRTQEITQKIFEIKEKTIVEILLWKNTIQLNYDFIFAYAYAGLTYKLDFSFLFSCHKYHLVVRGYNWYPPNWYVLPFSKIFEKNTPKNRTKPGKQNVTIRWESSRIYENAPKIIPIFTNYNRWLHFLKSSKKLIFNRQVPHRNVLSLFKLTEGLNCVDNWWPQSDVIIFLHIT